MESDILTVFQKPLRIGLSESQQMQALEKPIFTVP